MDETTIPRSELAETQVQIEYANPSDAEAIAAIKRQCWLQAYPNEEYGITKEDIEKRFPESQLPAAAENWQQGISQEVEGGERRTFVARFAGEVAGYTSPHIKDGQRRVGALYVCPKLQGIGIGSRLLQQAIDWHGREEDIFVRVVAYNDRAIGLYRNFGFQKTVDILDEFDDIEGLKPIPVIEMVLKAVH